MTDSSEFFTSFVFRLGVIGARIEGRYGEALTQEQVKPKHVALLAALRTGAPSSQLELAQLMQIAPSLVVLLADQLESLGAINRERDTTDRRRQRLVLTPSGRALLKRCTTLAAEMDKELHRTLGADLAVVNRGVDRIMMGQGLSLLYEST